MVLTSLVIFTVLVVIMSKYVKICQIPFPLLMLCHFILEVSPISRHPQLPAIRATAAGVWPWWSLSNTVATSVRWYQYRWYGYHLLLV